MKYIFVLLCSFYLLNACGCFDYDRYKENPPAAPEAVKKITIVNHINKPYKNNDLYKLSSRKSKGIWKLYSYKNIKINNIEAQKTIHKNQKGKALELDDLLSCYEHIPYGKGVSYTNEGLFFLFSLEDGKRKIFFGNHGYSYNEIWGKDESDCTSYYTWDIHPVWQEKELTIHIYEDRIEFSDPKIKEVKKVTASKSKEEIELKNLEIVPCDEE